MPYSALQMAEAFIQAGELDDALDALNQHLATAPTDEAARRLRAKICVRLAGSESIQTALDDLRHLSFPQPEDFILHSVLLEKASQQPAAVVALGEAVEQYPHDERLIERYVQLLRAVGSYQQAQDVVSRLLDDKAWRWFQWAGDLAVDMQDYAAAETHYTAAIQIIKQRYEIAPTMLATVARLKITRGHVLEMLEQWEQADNDYAAAARLIPDDAMIAFRRSVLAAKRGDMETAKQMCTQAFDTANPILRQHMLDDPEWGMLGL